MWLEIVWATKINRYRLSFLVLPSPICTLPTTTTYGVCQADEEVPIAPISEERATRTLSRIKLLNKIRNEIIHDENLVEHLSLCQRSSDLPEWWIPGRHDGELLTAAAKWVFQFSLLTWDNFIIFIPVSISLHVSFFEISCLEYIISI